MTTVIKKWGNSLAMRIPKDVAKRLDFSDGSEVLISVDNEQITIRKKRSFTLDDFMLGLSEENKHDEMQTGSLGLETQAF